MIKPIIALVPAAGLGQRMATDIPKQYLTIAEQPILSLTLDCLLSHPQIEQVVVVLNAFDSRFVNLPQASHPKLVTVDGGDERADSVLAGLAACDDEAWCLVHDAARPCLTHGDIDKLINSRERYPQGAILATPVRDTMKRDNGHDEINSTVSREGLWHALTPQFFPVAQLKLNLAQAIAAGVTVTDEASAMEWAGIAPGLVVGRLDNIKVTYPEDLPLVSLFLKNQAETIG